MTISMKAIQDELNATTPQRTPEEDRESMIALLTKLLAVNYEWLTSYERAGQDEQARVYRATISRLEARLLELTAHERAEFRSVSDAVNVAYGQHPLDWDAAPRQTMPVIDFDKIDEIPF